MNEQLNRHVDTIPDIRRLDLCAKKEILQENIEANKNLLDKRQNFQAKISSVCETTSTAIDKRKLHKTEKKLCRC